MSNPIIDIRKLIWRFVHLFATFIILFLTLKLGWLVNPIFPFLILVFFVLIDPLLDIFGGDEL